MKYTNPVVFQFVPGSGQVQRKNDIIAVPVNGRWNDFKENALSALNDVNYDSAIVSYKQVVDKIDNDEINKTVDIHTKGLLKQATAAGVPVFNVYNNQTYLLNPTPNELKNDAKDYAAPDDVVLAKHDSFEDDYAWQKHQSDIIKKFAKNMPLTTGGKYENSNHTAMLTEAKRGLTKNELDGFFSWKSNVTVIPELMQDDMIGMPGIRAKSFSDTSIAYHGETLPSTPLNMKTTGQQGAMIPMRNPRGDSPKYQIATDVTPFNVTLKAREKGGVSIQKNELFDKKNTSVSRLGEYKFTINGEPSHLHVEDANNDGITLADVKGEFDVSLKKNIKDTLVNRGYDMPEIIDSIIPLPAAKYSWMTPGTMVGSSKINKSSDPEHNKIAPSLAGFITAREPKNGSDEYFVVVAEGALKGVIASKYIDRPDENGHSVADFIAKDRGIIVAQVPGVAASFVKSVDRIYSEKKIAGTYIAMDADGRDNLNVARGIHSAFDEIGKNGPVKVMSWDPNQKGIDDSLIALANHKITLEDMDIHFGSAEKLFPLDEAEAPNPYKLDGTRANGTPEWQKEYAESKQARAKKIDKIQANNDTNIELSFEGLPNKKNEMQQ